MGFLEVLKGEEPGPITNLFHFYFVLGQDVGAHGEYLIEYALSNHNLEGNYRIYKNVYIPHGDTTSEIDLLLLHEKGIFVLESKNYSGWIFGDTDQVYWTQSLQKKKS